MPLDGISANCLAYELNNQLKDSRVDRIYQPDRLDILFLLRTNHGNKRLILSANPAHPRIHLTTETRENPTEPPMFCMLLRKHLLGARLIAIEPTGFERIITLVFLTTNELGDKLVKKLVIEIMGRHSNIIFLNADNRIHDAIVHVDQSVSRLREIMPARLYGAPQNQTKISPPDAMLMAQSGQLPLLPDSLQFKLEKSLLDSLQGFSPQLCQEICDRAGLDSRTLVNQLSREQSALICHVVITLLKPVLNGHYQPSTFYWQSNDKIPFDFHALHLQSLAHPKAESSLSEAMDHFYLARNRQNTITQHKQALQKRIEKEIDLTVRRMKTHEDELKESEKREVYRQSGELLIAQLHLVPDGATQVELQNYFDPELKLTRIDLQPQLSPRQNAQLFFKRYQKARGKQEMNERLILIDRRDYDWLSSIKVAIEKSNDEQDLQAIREEIAATGLSTPDRKARYNRIHGHDDIGDSLGNSYETNFKQIPVAKANGFEPGKPGSRAKRLSKQNQANAKLKKHAKSAKNPLPLPPRSFTSSDGMLIQAGRNNIQNDQLTLRTAQKDDIWLHAQKIPGTHVIIRSGKQKVPEQTLLEAAQLAAWYSQNQTGTKVAVDYCPVSHVKKISGGRPGLVQYEGYQTVLVEPKDFEQVLSHPQSSETESN
ncbi:MAG: NFACT RNA binding domain-containing protein [Eubacteriales bacterium]|nr:NFACT RNA binding domain-containing protein [Eubacteriales bacterium]